ncbi:hypothetical protein BH20ACT9_BH20ACT9_20210 [soil metagenome]
MLDHALVTAHTDDGYRLFRVDLRDPAAEPRPGRWVAVGMGPSDTIDVDLHAVAVPADGALGGPGWYLTRPGFWVGAVGVAACWYGAALGAARTLRRGVRARPDPHALAHLGAADAAVAAMATLLRDAAARVDAGGPSGGLRTSAMQVRASVEAMCQDVLVRVGRALGPGPLTVDERHARRAADLPVYLRQHHAERDLAELGADVLDRGRLV